MTSMRGSLLLAVSVLLLAGTVSATGELSFVEVEVADDDAELVEVCGPVVANTTLEVFGFLADALEAAAGEEGDADTPVLLSVNATRADVANAAVWMQIVEAVSKGEALGPAGFDTSITSAAALAGGYWMGKMILGGVLSSAGSILTEKAFGQ